MPRPAALGVTVGAAGLAVVVPLALVLALIGGTTAVLTATSTGGPAGLDPAKIPPLARALLPRITSHTQLHCPELPVAWVVAEVAAESGWNPAAFSRDRNGGAAGLYQLNQTNWVTAGGHPWTSTPPPLTADVFDPGRHLDLAIPFVCTHLRTATAHLHTTGKTAAPLDAMLVCHIAGCARVTGAATGIPTAGDAGCDTRCAALIADYLATVHHRLAEYAPAENAADPGMLDLRDLRVPAPFTGPDNGCTQPDPTSRGCLTPATRHALDQTLAAFGPPRPGAPVRRVVCWDPHPQNPRSDHRVGRACDLFPTTAGTFPTGTDLDNGWRLAAWLRTHAGELHIRYLIWQGRIWNPGTGDQNGWGTPYTGGGIYNPTDPTGGHYDHIHLSVR